MQIFSLCWDSDRWTSRCLIEKVGWRRLKGQRSSHSVDGRRSVNFELKQTNGTLDRVTIYM